MRVGANARQYARIKKLHKAGASAVDISATIQLTPQSLEKILAHLDGREEVILELEDNPNVQALRIENAELLAKLAEHEEQGDDNGAQKEESKEGQDAPEAQ